MMAIGRWLLVLAVVLALSCATGPAFAWVYTEHRDIAVLGIERLDPDRKALFDRLWAEARINREKRLCAQGADTAQGVLPECIDWAAMAAISGDHACSSKQLLDSISNSEWILDVADVGAQLKIDLLRVSKMAPAAPQKEGLIGDLRRQVESEGVRAARINALRDADLRLQHADMEYATRAGSNGRACSRPAPRRARCRPAPA